jgi:hypothetical protein
VLRQCREKLSPHQHNALQQTLQIPAGTLLCVLDGAIQVIDRSQQILDEILVPVPVRVLSFLQRAAAEILELGLEAQVVLLGGVELGAFRLVAGLEALELGRERLHHRLAGTDCGAGRGAGVGARLSPRLDGLAGLAQGGLELVGGAHRALGRGLGEGFPPLRFGLGLRLFFFGIPGFVGHRPWPHALSFLVIRREV